MNCVSLFIFISLLTLTTGKYNPIPIGSVIVSTLNKIFALQPKEYGGTDALITIYTASANMTIINTIYDPSLRNLYILYTNSTSNIVCLCKLLSLEQLDSTVYQLPITFNITNINRFNSFTSDIINRRGFLADENGTMKLFSMSGLMSIIISKPQNITDPIRSIAYANDLNKIYIITDTKINSCTNLEANNLQCCEGVARGNKLRSISFDHVSTDTYVYVIDENSGIYQVVFDSNNCPTALRPINTLGTYSNLHFAIDRGLYFASGSTQFGSDNSILIIANGTQTPRPIPVSAAIVAIHISSPDLTVTTQTEETCFHGIKYGDYRLAVLLAALFGTIMGIFMCFNALFCIDFFMTKRIIRSLKQQIPHNLLEDRWNKLVEEKYAKLALEQQRKKDDPPPKRRSSAAGRRISSAAATTDGSTSNQATEDNASRTDGLQVPNPIPKLSAYLRRKSESYVSRRRSDDYRSSRNQTAYEPEGRPPRTPRVPPQVHITPVQEENENQRGLRQNLSRQQLIKDEDFL